jgi:hypothetical protein
MEQEQSADLPVRLEKFRLLHQTLQQSISFGALLSVVAVAMLWSTQQPRLLLGWLGVHLLLSWWRLVVLWRFGRLQNDADAAMRLAPVVQLGIVLSGLVWGLLALLPYPAQDVNVALFITFVLAGVTAGGATAMVSDLVSALTFQVAVFSMLACGC